MNSSLKIDLYRVKQIILETIRANRSTTTDLLLDTLKSNYPNVRNIHLRYKLNKGMRELKIENMVQEFDKYRIDFGQNFHYWSQNICFIDLKIIQYLKILDKLLEEMM